MMRAQPPKWPDIRLSVVRQASACRYQHSACRWAATLITYDATFGFRCQPFDCANGPNADIIVKPVVSRADFADA